MLKDVNVDDDNNDNDEVEQVDERYLIIVRSCVKATDVVGAPSAPVYGRTAAHAFLASICMGFA